MFVAAKLPRPRSRPHFVAVRAFSKGCCNPSGG